VENRNERVIGKKQKGLSVVIFIFGTILFASTVFMMHLILPGVDFAESNIFGVLALILFLVASGAGGMFFIMFGIRLFLLPRNLVTIVDNMLILSAPQRILALDEIKDAPLKKSNTEGSPNFTIYMKDGTVHVQKYVYDVTQAIVELKKAIATCDWTERKLAQHQQKLQEANNVFTSVERTQRKWFFVTLLAAIPFFIYSAIKFSLSDGNSPIEFDIVMMILFLIIWVLLAFSVLPQFTAKKQRRRALIETLSIKDDIRKMERK